MVDNLPIQYKPNISCARVIATSDGANVGLILGLRPANEKSRYKVTPYLIGWAQT